MTAIQVKTGGIQPGKEPVKFDRLVDKGVSNGQGAGR
jgi:hypothetical protein